MCGVELQRPIILSQHIVIRQTSFNNIRLSIFTMTERIMYSERHEEYNITTKRTTNDKECQYTCLYNIRTMKLLYITNFCEFRNELSIMGSRPYAVV